MRCSLLAFIRALGMIHWRCLRSTSAQVAPSVSLARVAVRIQYDVRGDRLRVVSGLTGRSLGAVTASD